MNIGIKLEITNWQDSPEYWLRLNPSTEHVGIFNNPRKQQLPIMTLVTGALCSDGIVIVADRKITRIPKDDFQMKIFGDFKGFLIGYTGGTWIFDVFRKFSIGDSIVEKKMRYTKKNLICKLAKNL